MAKTIDHTGIGDLTQCPPQDEAEYEYHIGTEVFKFYVLDGGAIEVVCEDATIAECEDLEKAIEFCDHA